MKKKSKKIRPRITEEEYELIKGVRDACNELGVGIQDVPDGWLKSKNASLRFKNPNYVPQEQKGFKDFAEKMLSDIQAYTPTFRYIERETPKEGHLLVIDPADLHIGKLTSVFETGEAYNVDIACERARLGVQGILDKSASFNVDKIMFVAGNDVLHVDTPKSATTAGTPQDTDGMWFDNFIRAKDLYIELIEMLLVHADVHFVYNPSNHDYQSGFMLAQVIETYFRGCDNITFDVSIAHRKYFSYGENLIGTTHGDGAKVNDLPMLMAQEAKYDWADTKHRYFYTHHVHHKTAKDLIGVTVESLRSPSASDGWHAKKGFQHNPQAIEGFLHHKQHGQIARLSHIFSL